MEREQWRPARGARRAWKGSWAVGGTKCMEEAKSWVRGGYVADPADVI